MFVDSKLVLPGQCKIALSANVLPCKAHTSYLIHLNVSVPGSINPFVRSFTAQKVNNPLVFARVVVKTHRRRSIFFFYRPADHESPTQSHAIFDHRPSGTRQTARTTLASRIESGIGRFTKKGKNLIQRTLVHTTPDRNRRTKIQFCLLLFHCVWLFFIRLSASDGPSSPQSSPQSSSAPPHRHRREALLALCPQIIRTAAFPIRFFLMTSTTIGNRGIGTQNPFRSA